ncbi:TonB-dependent receptor [Desulfovibrio sp. UCD-KL4C]|uniref:TonB-dependent receptor n=1 Tax=Desulfovibrio sp. UCD-KL4C TaxID=2578120 RepID=UPI0025BA03CC|nr:TonB-dependent receptor [Desulfovibrio sp. UCD-KL4C]
MKLKRINGIIALLGVMLLSSNVYADEKKEHQLESMTVTAQKVGENIQDVPISITAFSDVMLEEKEINGFKDLIQYTPNMFLRKNSVDSEIVIRGISSFTSSLFSTAGFYVDGVNYPIHQMQDMDFIDIERVEVLKGPQGVLYGRNSQSGVISIITKQPTNEFSANLYADIGGWNANDGEMIFREGFNANIPVKKDIFNMRVSFQKEDSKGWMKNDYDNSDALEANRIGGRITGLWTPNEDLDVSLIVEGRNRDDGLGVYRFKDGKYATDHNELAWNGQNHNKVYSDSEIIKVAYRAESLDVTSVTGRHGYYQDFINDMDLSTQDYGNSWGKYDVQVISEEFKLSSKKDKNAEIDWVAGIYGYMENLDTQYYGFGLHDTDQDNWGTALFGQGTWNMTPDWHLTLGSRIDYVNIDAKKDLDLTDVGEGKSTLDGNISSVEFLPSVTLAYDISSDITSYAKVSRGYLAGGFDYATSITEDQFKYDPEYSINYEVGMKSTWFENTLTANAALFYIDITDKQVAQLEPTSVNPENRRIVNAARAQSYGGEIELQYKPIDGLLLTSSLGYTDSRLRDWKTEDSYNYDGKKTPGSPDWTYTVGATYRWDNGFMVGTDVTGLSSFYTDPKNSNKVDGRFLVNPRIGYEGENFDVILWAKNVFNEEYNENEWDWGESTLVQQGEPGSYGVRIGYHF